MWWIIIPCRSFFLTKSFYFHNMRYFVVICCVLASVSAKDKKISLIDIERDNVKSEKSVRTTPQKAPAGSPANYGFLPVKTAADYVRQQPRNQYVSAQYLPQQQYTPATQQYQTTPQQYQTTAQQYQTTAQQYQTTPQQYYYQTQPAAQGLYQQYDNIQYVADNSINAQQYYTPQFLYLQQYTAPSTSIQSVVDPKGGVQYVMYVPTYVPKAEQTQNFESIVYANDQQTYAIPETQYVSTQQQVVTPSIKYAEPQPQPQPQPRPQKVYTTSSQPKSLLDSYVPSILQLQYYKQQQAQANAIQQSAKDVSRPVTGKIEYAKTSYRPTQTQHNSAESVINYNYQVPNAYSKYAN